MNDKINVYAGGSISGLTYKQAAQWRIDLQKFFDTHMPGEFVALDPMRWLDGHDDDIISEEVLNCEASKIFARDYMDIAKSDYAIFYFQGTNVSRNSLVEIGICIERDIPFYVVNNPHNPTDCMFVRANAQSYFETWQECADAVMRIEGMRNR